MTAHKLIPKNVYQWYITKPNDVNAVEAEVTNQFGWSMSRWLMFLVPAMLRALKHTRKNNIDIRDHRYKINIKITVTKVLKDATKSNA